MGAMAMMHTRDRYICLECRYIYDPLRGDPKGNIPAGTLFTDLPKTWRCPECNISILKKGVFRRFEE